MEEAHTDSEMLWKLNKLIQKVQPDAFYYSDFSSFRALCVQFCIWYIDVFM